MTSSQIKAYKANNGHIVNHLTYIATQSEINIFDGDSELLSTSKIELDSQPLQIIRSSILTDPAFYILTADDVSQYRCKIEDFKGLKEMHIVHDWT